MVGVSFPAIEGAKILAVGADIRVPEAAYRIVSPEQMNYALPREPILQALAAKHGAVLFQLVESWPDAYPEFGILLRVEGAWNILELRLFDGVLQLLRDFHEPPAELVDFDASLLLALANGALGELTWDVIESDYGTYIATGHDGASLAEYLDPAVAREPQEARWREDFTWQYFDASGATSPAELVGLLSSFLGAPAPVADADFDHWLAARPLQTLPRMLEVTVGAALDARYGYQWFFDRVLASQQRVQWSVSLAPSICRAPPSDL